MPFAIMRSKKLKGMGSVASALQHAYRERETPNADPKLTPSNKLSYANSTNAAIGNLRGRLPEKYRKDAVLAVEYVMTASPEWWEQASDRDQAAFLEKSEAWLKDKYGEQNIIALVVHRDETTPHLSAFVVPKTADGRLSAKEFIGSADKMRRDQTSFADIVKDLGLERGVKGSRATHTTIQRWYEGLSAKTPPVPSVSVPEPTAMARINPSEYGKKVAESVIEQLKPLLDGLAAKAANENTAKKQAKTAEQARAAAVREKEALEERLKAVSLIAMERDAVVNLFTKEEIKTAKQRKIKQDFELEVKARIHAIPELVKRAVGAAKTFADNALEAIKNAGGDAEKVDWKRIDVATVKESIGQHGQPPDSVMEALFKHSPGRVDPAKQKELKEALEFVLPELQRQYEKAHDGGPSLST